jgi:diguanylate cyclase (GGDEF)-like protein/PAS domain S-box-containing protein
MVHSAWPALTAGVALPLVAVSTGLAWRRVRGGHQAEGRRQWVRRLADASLDGLLIHRNGTILQMNRALVHMLGYREVELVGSHFSGLAEPSQVAALRTELEAPRPQIVEFTLLHADKSQRFVEMASNTLELDGLPAMVTAIRDRTEMKALEARLAYLMHNDALSGLPNAAMFTEKLQEAVNRNDTAGGTTAVLRLRLEQLKAVNAQLGRRGGDVLIRQVAKRLGVLVHEDDMLARLSGNQFAILQPHGGAPNRTAALASQIESAMEEPLIVEGKPIKASFAVGIATYPEHATSAEGLLDASGFALSKAIETGSTHTFSHAEAAAAGFASASGAARSGGGGRMLSLEAQRLAYDLRVALPRGEVGLTYQPILTGRFLSLAGFEAVVEWRHPKEGDLPAERFIPLGDEAGLAGLLGPVISQTACTEAVLSKAPLMAISLSQGQFTDPLLPARLEDILHKTGLAPSRLELQLSETMLAGSPAAAMQVLGKLRDLGAILTLVTSGSSFASLAEPTQLPFRRLMIERRFVQRLDTDHGAQAVVAALISLAHTLSLEVRACGIESEAQLNFLRDKGCDFLQGDLLAKPAAHAAGAGPSGPPKPSLVVG